MGLTTEQSKAMLEARAAKQAERKAAGLPARAPQRARPQKAPRPPSRPASDRAPMRPGILPAGLYRKVEKFVARMIGLADAGGAWGAAQITRPVYEERQTGVDPAGVPITRMVQTARVRAFPDETIAADRLEPWEVDLLAEAVTAELIRYERVRRALVRLVELEERSTLPTALLIVAAPRMVRHGIIPAEFAEVVRAMRDAARTVRRAPRPRVDELAGEEPTTPRTPAEENGAGELTGTPPAPATVPAA